MGVRYPQLQRVIYGLRRNELVAGEKEFKVPVAVLFDQILFILFIQFLNSRYRGVDYEIYVVIAPVDKLLVEHRCTLFVS